MFFVDLLLSVCLGAVDSSCIYWIMIEIKKYEIILLPMKVVLKFEHTWKVSLLSVSWCVNCCNFCVIVGASRVCHCDISHEWLCHCDVSLKSVSCVFLWIVICVSLWCVTVMCHCNVWLCVKCHMCVTVNYHMFVTVKYHMWVTVKCHICVSEVLHVCHCEVSHVCHFVVSHVSMWSVTCVTVKCATVIVHYCASGNRSRAGRFIVQDTRVGATKTSRNEVRP